MTILHFPTETELNVALDFDHVVRVLDNGDVDTDPQFRLHAPTFEMSKVEGTDVWTEDRSQLGEWTLLSGHTGQYGYNGPVMHASEVIGGSIAQAILTHPGYYAALVVEAPCNYDGTTDCTEDNGCDCDAAGWAIAHIPA